MATEQTELPLDARGREIALEPPQDILHKLASLLTRDFVAIRIKAITFPVVYSLAVGMLSDALARGHLVDRSNGDGPLEEWDGWITIHAPEKTHVQTNWQPILKIGLDQKETRPPLSREPGYIV